MHAHPGAQAGQELVKQTLEQIGELSEQKQGSWINLSSVRTRKSLRGRRESRWWGCWLIMDEKDAQHCEATQIFSKSIFPVTQERPRLHESEHESTLLKSQNLHWLGNSLAAQWLGLVTLTMVAQVQFLVRELRFHKLCSTAPQNKNKTKNTLYCFEVSPSLSQRGRINTGDEGHGAEVED